MLHSVAMRRKTLQVVAGGRFELYSSYPIEIQAVAASISRAHCVFTL